ncbi:AmmeMemoRadiSam system protein B [Sansalvadorimonas verongulae]|uniref:AmmeMemoRadiSam system protein B n=1 Tax=Sansalvadorimonas verongulae TaxID=2172824 RepID=UPI0012BBF353|nr:AmmeMemoRadiSam system protein B [Sansalvadorimonas verongulae]MTI12893.1 AmmeMemoRadiSam system protein B [Sansalvadorimonas verongulae]
MMSVRQPAVAGTFYPANKTALKDAITHFLAEASEPDFSSRVLIVPHAGYIYSGEVAASAYKLLERYPHPVERVILLGPSHRTQLHGLALPGSSVFHTPLGAIEIDSELAERLVSFSQVQVLEAAHELEHSLEVQLPFLQVCLPDFKLLPLVVGEADSMAVSEVLESVWGGPETLIIISTDLSHFHTYHEAQTIDQHTANNIKDLQSSLTGDQACGCHPLNGLLSLAKEKGMTVETLDIRNSGDTAGSHDRVVGYGAFAIR